MDILLKEEDLGLKPCWKEIFGNEGPIYVEIGIGNGEFITHLAQSYEKANFIGVEVCRKILRKAVNRVKRAKVRNLKLIWIEGTKALAKFFDSETISGVYVNFPDPWEKKKQRHRRLINPGFVWILADRLKLNGFFKVVTDHEEYVKEIIEIFNQNEAFYPLYDPPVTNYIDDFYPTKYARKWSSLGKKLYFTGFKKVKNLSLPEWVKDWCPILKLSKEDVLPIVSLLNIDEKLDFKILGALFKNQTFRYEDDKVIIRFLDVFYQEEGILLDTLVCEGIVKQRFFIYLGKYKKDEIIIKIHDSDKPDPTEGIHLALAIVLKKLKESFPKINLIKTTCKEKILRKISLEEKG